MKSSIWGKVKNTGRVLYESKVFIFLLLLSSLPLIAFMVYLTGGIKYVFSHTMYVPILLAGILLGPKAGIVIALIGGFLLGPIMPIDTVTMEPQLWFNWMYRLGMFVMIGWMSGFAFQRIKQSIIKMDQLMSMNQETQVPNTNYLKRIRQLLPSGEYTIVTILIGNHYNILDILGTTIYHALVHDLYTELSQSLNKPNIIIQSDNNKLWVIQPYEDSMQAISNTLEIINRPRQIQQIPLYIDLSLGVSQGVDKDILDTPSAYEASDMAARYAQVNNLDYFIHDQVKYNRRSEYDLLAVFSRALEEGQLFLVYQPKIDLKTNKTMGLEALIRWNHPQRGLISPNHFIPLIEETKLIHKLTDFVLKETLVFIKQLLTKKIAIPISINVSPKNLSDLKFHERVIHMISQYKVPKQYVKIEITESAIMVQPKDSQYILEQLVKHGVLVELDDFGKGYSSLSSLSQFPISTIKIDRFFTQDMLVQQTTLEIVKSTIELSKRLHYSVLAEGVENQETRDLLMELQCDYAQGFFFCKPIEKESIVQMLLAEQA